MFGEIIARAFTRRPREGGQSDVTPDRAEASLRARAAIDKNIVAESGHEELL